MATADEDVMGKISKKQLLLALFVAALLAAPSAAQSGRIPTKRPEPQKPVDDAPIRLRAEEVLLPINVRSNLGKLPSSLERADFIITEDGKRQQITSILHTPANILFILDASGDATTLKNVNVHRELALKLIESLDDGDKIALIAYADKARILSSWTDDRDALKKALDWNFRPGPGSRLYDSLASAADDLLPKATGRRSIILMTDGVDTSSQTGFEASLLALDRERATVYVISQAAMLLRELKPRIAKRPPAWQWIDVVVRQRYQALQEYVRQLEAGLAPLHKLVDETGGAIWEPEEPVRCLAVKPFDGPPAQPRREMVIDCKAIRDQLLGEIGSEYVIAYSIERPADDARFHPVNVYSARGPQGARPPRGLRDRTRERDRAAE